MNIDMMGHPENTEMDFDLITELGSRERDCFKNGKTKNQTNKTTYSPRDFVMLCLDVLPIVLGRGLGRVFSNSWSHRDASGSDGGVISSGSKEKRKIVQFRDGSPH